MLKTESWFCWHHFLSSQGNKTPRELSALLDIAFSQNLKRSTGWDLRGIEDQELKALCIQGAKLYKRGVAWRTEKGEFQERPAFKSTPIVYVESLTELLNNLPKDALFFIDRQLLNFYPSLEEFSFMTLEVSEHHKSLPEVQKILERTRHQPSQNWVAMGGGILTDMVGFAASLAKASLILVPTTLLGMVDAALGGKTGVNFSPYGKNQVGSFYFPDKIFIYPEWLDTLSPFELVCGGAECIKHVMLDGDLPLFLETCAVFTKLDRARIKKLIPSWIKTKEKIVLKDPYERGERATLNLGHTLAHALEGFSLDIGSEKTSIPHGVAVGHGLIFSVLISMAEGLMEKSYGEKIIEALGQVFNSEAVGHEINGLFQHGIWPSLVTYLLHDKKKVTSDQGIPFVLVHQIGSVICQAEKNKYTVPVSFSTLEEVWKKTCTLKLNSVGRRQPFF